jgi:hypothetical protein
VEAVKGERVPRVGTVASWPEGTGGCIDQGRGRRAGCGEEEEKARRILQSFFTELNFTQ